MSQQEQWFTRIESLTSLFSLRPKKNLICRIKSAVTVGPKFLKIRKSEGYGRGGTFHYLFWTIDDIVWRMIFKLAFLAQFLSTVQSDSSCVASLSGVGSSPTDKIDASALDAVLDLVQPWLFLPLADVVVPPILSYETPIQFRTAYYVASASYTATSSYHETALEPYGRQDLSTQWRRCASLKTDDALMWNRHEQLSVTYAFSGIAVYLMPHIRSNIEAGFESLGLNYSLIDDPVDLSTPWGHARAIIEDLEVIAEADGWNHDGSLTNTFNKLPYNDFSFEDVNGDIYTPYKVDNSFNPEDFIIKKGKRKLKDLYPWQPLIEGNGFGYHTQQMHVTPFAGYTTRTYGLTEEEFLDASDLIGEPHYDYEKEVDLLLKRVGELGTDDQKKMLTEFYDSKLTSILPMSITYSILNGHSLFRFFYMDIVLNAAMYNAVLLSWRKKVEFNAIRPPTIVHALKAGQKVESYGGPYAGKVTMNAEDWQPYYRTMPHAEYPSGSSCVCKAFTDAMILLEGSDNIATPLEQVFAAGSSRREPGATPASDVRITYTTWRDVLTDCGQSRLYGGLHFTASVSAGEVLASSIAAPIVEKIELLLSGNSAGAFSDPSNLAINAIPLRKGGKGGKGGKPKAGKRSLRSSGIPSSA